MHALERLQYELGVRDKTVVRDLRSFHPILKDIHRRQVRLQDRSDAQLQAEAALLADRARSGLTADELLPPAFALVKEAAHRTLGLSAYDEQLLAAIALHQRKLVELPTGEGKTLAAAFPAFLNALTGKGVHVLTFNDYLARRDAGWMGPLYRLLGLSVGFVVAGMSAAEKVRAYRKDITYATAKEVGFDYLRDKGAYRREEIVLRPFHYAIVDEADAILIDEARSPLVLAGRLDADAPDLDRIDRLARELVSRQAVEVDDRFNQVHLRAEGIALAEAAFGLDNLFLPEHLPLLSALNLSLQAHVLLQRDVDYLLREGEVLLIDAFTGRITPDRKWKNGLQAAVETKEGVPLRSEGSILNAITLPHFLQKYPGLAGMTATAREAAEEFAEFYGLPTVIIPPHRPCRRVDQPDRVFAGRQEKLEAVVGEVVAVHATRQPILIGTLSVRESEELAGLIAARGIPCTALNARNDAEEAKIISRAGRPGAVTISTNMAGRGTDILLGGGQEAERALVESLGGLYVIGTNRHESLRIDRQLRGRSGRQGDPGESRFFISLDDELFEKYRLREELPKRYRQAKGGEPLAGRKLPQWIRTGQRMIEGRLFDRRKMLYEYSSLLEAQRILWQGERQRSLLDPELSPGYREQVLAQYDRLWAEHLDELSEARENIQLVRLGGQQPLREFRKLADERFQERRRELAAELRVLAADPAAYAKGRRVQRPASTWTYLLNDNPFGNQLSVLLLDGGNTGLQVDFVSGLALGFFALFRKWFGRKDNTLDG